MSYEDKQAEFLTRSKGEELWGRVLQTPDHHHSKGINYV